MNRSTKKKLRKSRLLRTLLFNPVVLNQYKKIGRKKRIEAFRKGKFVFDRGELSRSRYELFTSDTVPLPRRIVYEPTMRCNLKCQGCFQDSARDLRYKELSIPEIKTIFSEDPWLSGIDDLHIIGSECFMRSDIYEIFELLESLDIPFDIFTNGTLINYDTVSRLKNFRCLTGITTSVDGGRELHNSLRGVPFAYDRTVETIQLINRELCFYAAVNARFLEENYNELVGMVDFCASLGVYILSYELDIYSTPQELSESLEILGVESQEISVQIREDASRHFSLEELKNTWRDIVEAGKKAGVIPIIKPGLCTTRMKDFYYERVRDNGAQLLCQDLLSGRIDPEGNVIPCVFIRIKMGNLFQNSFSEIWNYQKYRAFRKKMVDNTMLPICKRCEKIRYVV